MFKKKWLKKPVSRAFWTYLRHLPAPIRASIVRSKFEIDYNLPKEIVFKLAETKDEIHQALRLVYESYRDLDYIDELAAGLHLTKYHSHPNSAILIIKSKDEVIGTLTIIPDSALGLPAETTWPLDTYKNSGKIIAEISSLTIKKNNSLRRGKLLLPLCKYMYIFCKEYLQLDGVVAATSDLVEPFYTDILLFERVTTKAVQNHSLVKGRPSTCGYLQLGGKTEVLGKKIYNNKPDNRNLYKYFIETKTENFIFPTKKLSIPAYLMQKNESLAGILRTNSGLLDNLDYNEKSILKNHDLNGYFDELFATGSLAPLFQKKLPRVEVRSAASCYDGSNTEPIQCRIVDISLEGVKLHFTNTNRPPYQGQELSLAISHNENLFFCKVVVKWIRGGSIAGCQIMNKTKELCNFIDALSSEIHAHTNSNKVAS